MKNSFKKENIVKSCTVFLCLLLTGCGTIGLAREAAFESAFDNAQEEEEVDMLLRKTAWFWKSGLVVISFLLMLSVSGCSDAPPEEDTVSETVIDIQAIPEEPQENAEEIINICIDLYKKAAEENKIADLETIRSIVNCLGENGYPAVDSRNQVNMTEAEQVL